MRSAASAADVADQQDALHDLLVGLRVEKELAASSTAAPPSPLLVSGEHYMLCSLFH